jgi:hypothetical protein
MIGEGGPCPFLSYTLAFALQLRKSAENLSQGNIIVTILTELYIYIYIHTRARAHTHTHTDTHPPYLSHTHTHKNPCAQEFSCCIKLVMKPILVVC